MSLEIKERKIVMLGLLAALAVMAVAAVVELPPGAFADKGGNGHGKGGGGGGHDDDGGANSDAFIIVPSMLPSAYA